MVTNENDTRLHVDDTNREPYMVQTFAARKWTNFARYADREEAVRMAESITASAYPNGRFHGDHYGDPYETATMPMLERERAVREVLRYADLVTSWEPGVYRTDSPQARDELKGLHTAVANLRKLDRRAFKGEPPRG